MYWRVHAHLKFQGSEWNNTLKWNCFLCWLICHTQLWDCKTSAQCTVFDSVLSIFGSLKTDFVAECGSWLKPKKYLDLQLLFWILVLKHLSTSQEMDAVLDPATRNCSVHGMLMSLVQLLAVGPNISNKWFEECGFPGFSAYC